MKLKREYMPKLLPRLVLKLHLIKRRSKNDLFKISNIREVGINASYYKTIKSETHQLSITKCEEQSSHSTSKPINKASHVLPLSLLPSKY